MNPIPTWRALPTWAKLASLPLIIAGLAIALEVVAITMLSAAAIADAASNKVRKIFGKKNGPKVIEAA